ncbi:MAG TPA: endonuclease/exonuclease/phosphatase family protein [Planctomycetota bacterium]|nr:endonuclease/exonuclease/phosphatase family protein [Planctomycetota bacterium]
MSAEPWRLVLATYNVHGWVDRRGRRDAARALAVIAELEADVVALQEVYDPGLDPVDTRRLELFASLEGHECLLGPTLRARGERYGNALLTRFPVLALDRHALAVEGREPRGLIEARLDTPGTPLRILCTHLGLSRRERWRQVGWIAERVEHLDGPLALLGDFNTPLQRAPLVPITDRLGHAPLARSWPARFPLLPLDRIWIHPPSLLIRLRAHQSPAARRASDHLPVVAEIAWPPAA